MGRIGRMGRNPSSPTARGAPPPLARAAALEDSLSSRGPQALPLYCVSTSALFMRNAGVWTIASTKADIL